jgi:hypothetical protein
MHVPYRLDAVELGRINWSESHLESKFRCSCSGFKRCMDLQLVDHQQDVIKWELGSVVIKELLELRNSDTLFERHHEFNAKLSRHSSKDCYRSCVECRHVKADVLLEWSPFPLWKGRLGDHHFVTMNDSEPFCDSISNCLTQSCSLILSSVIPSIPWLFGVSDTLEFDS